MSTSKTTMNDSERKFTRFSIGFLEFVVPILKEKDYAVIKQVLKPDQAMDLAMCFAPLIEPSSVFVLLGQPFPAKQFITGQNYEFERMDPAAAEIMLVATDALNTAMKNKNGKPLNVIGIGSTTEEIVLEYIEKAMFSEDIHANGVKESCSFCAVIYPLFLFAENEKKLQDAIKYYLKNMMKFGDGIRDNKIEQLSWFENYLENCIFGESKNLLTSTIGFWDYMEEGGTDLSLLLNDGWKILMKKALISQGFENMNIRVI